MASNYKKNHVISQLLLERFTNENGQIVKHSKRYGKKYLTTPGREGFRKGLWRVGSAKLLEELWNQEAESEIKKTLAKIDTQARLFNSDLDILARFCAIHFVRSNEFIELHLAMLAKKREEIMQDISFDLADRYLLAKELDRQTRIPSQFFEEGVKKHYSQAVDYLKKFGIEIAVATGSERFIIPDSGLCVADIEAGKYQARGGVALLDAKQASLIVSPTCFIAFQTYRGKKKARYIEVNDEHVKRANEHFKQAVLYDYYEQPK